MGIRALTGAPDWSTSHHCGEAKCRDESLRPTRKRDLFFEDEELSLSICNGTYDGLVCPRRTECLHVSMVNKENYGVWGGMIPQERLDMRLKYPAMPERWTWHPPGYQNQAEEEETPCP